MYLARRFLFSLLCNKFCFDCAHCNACIRFMVRNMQGVFLFEPFWVLPSVNMIDAEITLFVLAFYSLLRPWVSQSFAVPMAHIIYYQPHGYHDGFLSSKQEVLKNLVRQKEIEFD